MAFSPRLPIRQPSWGYSSPSKHSQPAAAGYQSLNKRLDDYQCPSSSIATSKGADALLFASREFVENAEEGLERRPVDSSSEAKDLETFINKSLSSSEENLEDNTENKAIFTDKEDSKKDDKGNSEEDDKKANKRAKTKANKAAPISYVKEKLIGILDGTKTVPKK